MDDMDDTTMENPNLDAAFTDLWPETATLSEDQLSALMAPLHRGRVKKRTQGGQSLSYVEAYDVKATLIRIFGFGGFSADVIDSRLIQVREAQTHPQHTDKSGNPKTPQAICQATVRLHVPVLGATYTETAVGHSQQWDIGEAIDMAMKTAESDALKRCATYLGTQFGLGLYDEGSLNEVVRIILAPGQKEMLADIVAKRAPANERAGEQLSTALGASRS